MWRVFCPVDNPFGTNHNGNQGHVHDPSHHFPSENHCQLEVWAPGRHNHTEDMAFNLFAMSVEEERTRARQRF